MEAAGAALRAARAGAPTDSIAPPKAACDACACLFPSTAHGIRATRVRSKQNTLRSCTPSWRINSRSNAPSAGDMVLASDPRKTPHHAL